MKYSKSYFYTSSKFLGLVFSLDCSVPQHDFKNPTVLVVEVKFLFVGFWIDFTKN